MAQQLISGTHVHQRQQHDLALEPAHRRRPLDVALLEDLERDGPPVEHVGVHLPHSNSNGQ